jgi:hypothetical protein
MRRMFLLACALGLAFAAKNSQLEAVHAVYLLPMSGSLDQYLATRLTQGGVFQVVTDPQKADAVFTDKIGKGFEDTMDELYAPAVKKSEEDEDKNKDAWSKPAERLGSSSRGKGTVFLVDRHSRNVVWSIYLPSRSSRPDEVNSRARQITDKLVKDLRQK